MDHAFAAASKKCLQNSRSQIYRGTLYSRIFINLGCTFSSMFHVELNFVQSMKYTLRFTPLLTPFS